MKAITFSKIVKYIFFLPVVLITTDLIGQEEEEEKVTPFFISGSIDAYYRANFNGLNSLEYDSAGEVTGLPQAPATSFADDPGFALGMANVILGYEGEKVGFVADLVFGPRGEEAVFLSAPSTNIVNQLYAYYQVSDGLTFTLGNWNTFLGYEVISPVINFNYSTSYMFSYGPFSHSGLKADFDLSEHWTGMLAIMNPTDFTEFNPFGLYSFGGQLGYANDAGSAYLNLIYGEQAPESEPTFQVDLTTGWDLTDRFYLGLNSTYNTTDGVGFYGAALYPRIQATENFALGLRAEYFRELEEGGPVYGADVRSLDFTLTGSYAVGGLILKPELRLDSVSEEVFTNRDLGTTDKLSSFVLAVIYGF